MPAEPRRLGHEADCAGGGRKALTYLGARVPGLVLLTYSSADSVLAGLSLLAPHTRGWSAWWAADLFACLATELFSAVRAEGPADSIPHDRFTRLRP